MTCFARGIDSQKGADGTPAGQPRGCFIVCSQSVKELSSWPPFRKASAKVQPFSEPAKLSGSFFSKMRKICNFGQKKGNKEGQKRGKGGKKGGGGEDGRAGRWRGDEGEREGKDGGEAAGKPPPASMGRGGEREKKRGGKRLALSPSGYLGKMNRSRLFVLLVG